MFLISALVIIVFLSAILPPFFFHLEGFKDASYSTYLGNQPLDSRISNLIDPTQDRTCKKIYGFDGLYCTPESQSGGIDVFYGLKSSTTCEGSGLTKSGGNLCIDGPAYKLLTSRGGNATGANSTTGTKDSVIG
jgi:hypothetical protein